MQAVLLVLSLDDDDVARFPLHISLSPAIASNLN